MRVEKFNEALLVYTRLTYSLIQTLYSEFVSAKNHIEILVKEDHNSC